ncbi:jg21578, partial [Pararge aegeria aegeria]
TVLEVMEGIQKQTGCSDILEFFRSMLTYTRTKSLRHAWNVIVTVTKKNDIFVLLESMKVYTSMDIMYFFQMLQRITNTTTVRLATLKVTELFKVPGEIQINVNLPLNY